MKNLFNTVKNATNTHFDKLTHQMKNGESFIHIDIIVEKIASLGVAGVILMFVIGTTGWTGAAAITAGLSAFGPGGMLGGVISFGVAVMLLQAINKFGFDTLFKAVIRKMIDNGTSIDMIKKSIKKTPISKELKNKLYVYIEKCI